MSRMVFSLCGHTTDLNMTELGHQTSHPLVKQSHFNVDTGGKRKIISERGFN